MLRNSRGITNDRVSFDPKILQCDFEHIKLQSYHFTESAASKKGNVFSMHLNNLMELTTKDPDPYFFGSYNWYYTGGTLETASIFDVDFLFYVTGERLNIFSKSNNSYQVEGETYFETKKYLFILDSSVLKSNKNRLQLEHLDSTNEHICDTIFEIIKSTENSYVAARQKHRCTVFALQDELAHQDFNCERNIPFLSATFNEKHFFTIDANRVIQRHDLLANRECGRMHLKLPKNNSFWCQLRTYNNQLIFADQHKIKIYDSRLFANKLSKCMEISMDSVTEKCEEITCVRADADENNLYVSTSHNLFVFDIRYGTECGNQLARYTHQMKTPPLMIDASGGGASGCAPNERLIALSGTYTDDIAIAQHIKGQNDKVRNHNIPHKILGLSDASKQLRENGLLTEAKHLLNENRSVNIGARFARKDSNLYLLSEKSSGEIFYQQITSDEGQANEEIDDKLFRNLDLGREDQKCPPKVTTVTNFDSIKKILKFKLPENDTDELDIENTQPKKWQKSIEQLQAYKDMLSGELLSVWNEQQIPEKEDKTDKTDYVSGWVNKSTADETFDEDDRDEPHHSFSMR